MTEGLYALRSFGSTGTGNTVERGPLQSLLQERKLRERSAICVEVNQRKKLLRTTDATFRTSPFCRRHLESAGEKVYLLEVSIVPWLHS